MLALNVIFYSLLAEGETLNTCPNVQLSSKALLFHLSDWMKVQL